MAQAAVAQEVALEPNVNDDWVGPAARAHVPVEVAREVWQRDRGACVFVGVDGVVCGAKHRLQLQHMTPVAKGGLPIASNLKIYCEPHNQLAADHDFGRAYMDRRRHEAPLTGHAADVAAALNNLGYRKSESQEAVRLVVARGEDGESFLELLKASLSVLARTKPKEPTAPNGVPG